MFSSRVLGPNLLQRSASATPTLLFTNLSSFFMTFPFFCSSRVIRVGDCVRYVNGKPVNGRPVDEVLKDIVGEEGQAVEVSLRAADEAKSQVRFIF